MPLQRFTGKLASKSTQRLLLERMDAPVMQILSPFQSDLWNSWLAAQADTGAALRAEFQRPFLQSHERYPGIAYLPPLFDQVFLDELGADIAALLRVVRSLPERLFDGDVARMLDFQGVSDSERDLVLAWSDNTALDQPCCLHAPTCYWPKLARTLLK